MKFAVAALVGSATATYSVMDPTEYEFMNYIAKHGKNYATKEEYKLRLKQFTRSLKEIEKLNATYKSSRHGVNQFSDRTQAEMDEIMGYKEEMDTNTDHKFKVQPVSEDDILEPIDWRDLGAVTAVKDQGQCGSCWSFSSTGAIEGAEFVAGNGLPVLSEQEFLDCSHFPDMGCNGGAMGIALHFAKRRQVMSESAYPYEAKSGIFKKCQFKKKEAVTHIKEIKRAEKSFEGLKTNLKKFGPTSISVAASKDYFHQYEGGILTDPKACGHRLDHGVLAVGWGSDPTYGEYAIVKNSWTTGWGEDGYVRLGMQGKHGVCDFVKRAPHSVISKSHKKK